MATNRPPTTQSRRKKLRREAVYKMSTGCKMAATDALKESTEDEIEGLIAGYMQLMVPEEGVEEMTLPIEAIQQLAVFATSSVSRILLERQ